MSGKHGKEPCAGGCGRSGHYANPEGKCRECRKTRCKYCKTEITPRIPTDVCGECRTRRDKLAETEAFV